MMASPHRTQLERDTMIEKPFITEAETLKNAILALAADRAALENFEDYLSNHFGEWLKCYIRTPGDMCAEFTEFSQMFAKKDA